MKKIDLNKRQSEVIDAMRFPLIVLVVFIHVLPFNLEPIKLELSSHSIYIFITEMISHNLGRIAVPCFFLFSGYFFFRNMEKWSKRFCANQLKKRVKTLLTPYILWNTITIVISLGIGVLYGYLNIKSENNYNLLQNHSLFDLFYGMPINFPLWYIRDLICMVAITPLFYYFFKHLKTCGLAALFGYYLSNFDLGIIGFSSTAIFYFGAGAYFGIYKKNILEIAIKVKKTSLILSILLLFTATLLNGNGYIYELVVRLFIPIAILSLFNIINKAIYNNIFKSITTKLLPTVFFIYAAHSVFIIGYTKGLVYRVSFFTSEIGLFIAYILIPTITIGICLSLYYLWRKISPKTLSFFVGGRV